MEFPEVACQESLAQSGAPVPEGQRNGKRELQNRKICLPTSPYATAALKGVESLEKGKCKNF